MFSKMLKWWFANFEKKNSGNIENLLLQLAGWVAEFLIHVLQTTV
jgi:hypothetical protein